MKRISVKLTTLVSIAALVLGAQGVARAATVVVGEGRLDGWDISNRDGTTLTEGPGETTNHTMGAFTVGPATPPMGAGSFHQIVGDSDTDQQALRTTLYNGMALSAITTLKYSSHVTSNQGSQASFLRLYVDLNDNGTYELGIDDTLNFEPAYQSGGYSGDVVPIQCGSPCIVKNQWQTWDAFAGGWWTGSSGTSGPPLTTLARYTSGHSGAKLITAPATPAVQLVAGYGGSWKNFDGNTDALTVNGTTFDFEPVPHAPVITVPSNGAAFPRTSISVSGTSDSGATIKINDGDTTIKTVDSPSGRWNATLTLAEGSHELTAIATKLGVDSPPSASVTVRVDLTPPGAPVITNPAPDSLNPQRVALGGTGEPGVRIRVYEGGVILTTTPVKSDGTWQQDWVFTDGRHTIFAVALDAAGNTSEDSAKHSFEVDTFAPTVHITAPDAQHVFAPGETVTVKGNASDNRRVASVEVTYTDALGRMSHRSTLTFADASVTWTDTPTLLPGYYRVQAVAVDRVGNRSTQDSTTFITVPSPVAPPSP